MKILIIGAGTSSGELLSYKDSLRKHFGKIIVVNSNFIHFDDVSDIFLATEKYLTEISEMNTGKYSKTVRRLVNYKTIHTYNKAYNLEPITRAQKPPDFDIRKYIQGQHSPNALLVGPLGSSKTSLGSVVLSAIHLACIEGATEVYLSGVDLRFIGKYDHLVKNRVYRDKQYTHPQAAKPIVVNIDGEEIETTDYMFESAPVLDSFMKNEFSDIKFYNFGEKSLLKYPQKIDLALFVGHVVNKL